MKFLTSIREHVSRALEKDSTAGAIAIGIGTWCGLLGSLYLFFLVGAEANATARVLLGITFFTLFVLGVFFTLGGLDMILHPDPKHK